MNYHFLKQNPGFKSPLPSVGLKFLHGTFRMLGSGGLLGAKGPFYAQAPINTNNIVT